jgi:hypothetical protein
LRGLFWVVQQHVLGIVKHTCNIGKTHILP